jgi:hypothetical protein
MPLTLPHCLTIKAPATYGSTQDRLTSKTVGFLLDQEPTTDLVVVNGDMISRDNLMTNSTGYLDLAVQPLLERNLTWASLYGNHESNNVRDVKDVFARERTWANARTRSLISGHQDVVGITNYYLPVFASSCPSGCGCTPELILWFFDSRSGFKHNTLVNGKQVDRQNWVDPGLAAWFTTENERITAKFGKTIPSLSFVHIPPNSFYSIQTGPGIDPDRNPGINDNFESGQAEGYCSDGVKNGTCAWGQQDVPFMQALASTPSLMGVFSAHKHGNSWCYKWTDETMPGYPVQPSSEGLNICYGQRTGYGGGGNWQRGARQLLVHKDDLVNSELKTWIRLETGEVAGSVSLNSTFGQDVYQRSPNRLTFCEECKFAPLSERENAW